MSDFEGQGSRNVLRKDKPCKRCKKTGGVYYRGSSVEHGNPYSPAADTDVTHYFYCENCQQHFQEYA